jgi:hypothetical protein
LPPMAAPLLQQRDRSTWLRKANPPRPIDELRAN